MIFKNKTPALRFKYKKPKLGQPPEKNVKEDFIYNRRTLLERQIY